MPADFAVMEAQHRAVIETLTAAMAELRSEFKRRWEDQQHGTVMKDLLTMSRFYEGNEAIATATAATPPLSLSLSLPVARPTCGGDCFCVSWFIP